MNRSTCQCRDMGYISGLEKIHKKSYTTTAAKPKYDCNKEAVQ